MSTVLVVFHQNPNEPRVQAAQVQHRERPHDEDDGDEPHHVERKVSNVDVDAVERHHVRHGMGSSLSGVEERRWSSETVEGLHGEGVPLNDTSLPYKKYPRLAYSNTKRRIFTMQTVSVCRAYALRTVTHRPP